MKHLLFLFLFFTICFSADAQNYQCLQSGVKHYFINGNGYLRGIRIDSVRTFADSTIYYPFHTPRGRYSGVSGSSMWSDTLDANGGSWLGKKVIQRSDGAFVFDDIWHDSVVIKTQAHLGDSWTFYRDTTASYYQASVLAMDTMTISGSVDSVKWILITSLNSSGVVLSDPLNGFKFSLSKNNGFVQVFDLYTFPYHPPDSAFTGGIDYYLDNLFMYGPTLSAYTNSIFSLTTLFNPTLAQLWNWNIGDAFLYSHCAPFIEGSCLYPYQYYYDSIVGKTTFPDSVQYLFTGWLSTQVFPITIPFVPDLEYSYSTVPNGGSLSYTNDLLLDTNLMPEEINQPNFISYFPYDSSVCLNSCKYEFDQNNLDGNLWYPFFETIPLRQIYKVGSGLLYYNEGNDGSNPSVENTTLLYDNKSGIPCGYPPGNPLAVIGPGLNNFSLQIFPNPATSQLTISSTNQPITQITISNLLGQTVFSNNYNAEKVEVAVAGLPSGVYFVKINGSEVRKFVKE